MSKIYSVVQLTFPDNSVYYLVTTSSPKQAGQIAMRRVLDPTQKHSNSKFGMHVRNMRTPITDVIIDLLTEWRDENLANEYFNDCCDATHPTLLLNSFRKSVRT